MPHQGGGPLSGPPRMLQSARPVLLLRVSQQPALHQPVDGRAERDLDNAGVAADLDRAGDRRAVAHLGHGHPEQRGRALETVLGRCVEVRAGADHGDGLRGLELPDAVEPGERARLRRLLGGQRTREVREVLEHGEQHRPVELEALNHLDLERHGPRDVARVTGDLAVALHSVHVAEVDTAAIDLHRADEDRAGSPGVSAKACGAPIRNEPKSPALCESGIVVEGVVPSCPRNGRSRATVATRSCGANSRIGCCAELSGRAASRAASLANRSAASRPTVTPTEWVASNAIVYPCANVNGDASAPHPVQRIDSGPMPSTRVSGHSAPQPGQTGAQYGSPLKRPSIIASCPDAVASDVTSMSRIRIAIASPTRAPATATGWATSCPPRIDGVIIGPQQPGALLTTMCPPSATGPSIATSGPSKPLVNVSTSTVCRPGATAVSMSIACVAMVLLSGQPGPPATGIRNATSSPAARVRERSACSPPITVSA